MITKFKILFILIISFGFLIQSCEISEIQPASTPTYTLTTSVTPNHGGSLNVSPQSPIYQSGDVVTITPQPNEGWASEKWEGDGSGNSNPLQVIFRSNQSIMGIFKRRDYPLNITIIGEGTVEEKLVTNQSGREYPYETVVELTPIPKEGWVFDTFEGDLTGTTTPQNITIDKEKNVTVRFVEVSKFFLNENGVTCMCPNTFPGEIGFINGVEYESVDNDLLRKRRNEGVDMTRLCT